MSPESPTAARRAPGVLLAGAALVAAALGGAGSYALWSAGAAGTAGTIASGDLDAVALGSLTWTPHPDNADPDVLGSGERAWAVQAFDLALDGDNLTADATVDVTVDAELDYPYQWFVSTDPAIADPHAAVAAGSIPGLVRSPSDAPTGKVSSLTQSDLPDGLDGSADWFVYVLVENPHPLRTGDPDDLDLLTVRAELTLEQTS
ncbi:hypothetical protein ACPYO6_07405 [Georgenia sp. Z1344]|uniref:hypothetical protein n=1 Tax=Georgenia sp. Z1344 TaxID=3416706 RepID=UPI003CF5B847